MSRAPTPLLVAALLLSLPGCLVPQGPSVDPNARIVVFGDSTVRGPAESDFAEKLPPLLNIPTEAVANAGQGGELLLFGKERLQQLVERNIYPAADTLVFIEGGNELLGFIESNDPQLDRLLGSDSATLEAELQEILDQVEQDLIDVVATGTAAGWTVYLMTYQPIGDQVSCELAADGAVRAADRPVLDAYAGLFNERVRAVVAATDAQLIDVATLNDVLLADPTSNYFNCTHLSGTGNQLVAELVAATLSN